MSRWRIHLGAHKTATTHAQQTLALLGHAPALDDVRAAFWRQPEDRRILGKDLLGHRRWSALRQFDKFAVISDENILCEAYEACSGYDRPWLENRLRRLKRTLGAKETKAFLAIRNPAEFAASIYSETLRHHPEWADREATRSAWSKGDQWLGLVDAISQHFDLTVWRYEDYRTNQRQILEALSGADLPDTLPHLPDPPATQRLSAEEVSGIEGGGTVLAPGTKMPKQSGRFQLFDSDEYENLQEVYGAEWAQISERAHTLTFPSS